MSTTAVLLSLLFAAAPGGCVDGEAAPAIQATEARLVDRAVPKIPADGQIGMQAPLCVRVAFHIDSRGLPTDVHVDKSSKNRAWDLAGVEAVRKSRFRPSTSDTPGQDFYLIYSFDK